MRFTSIAFVLLFAMAASASVHAAPEDDLAALIASRDEAMAARYPSAALTRGDRRFLDRFEETLTDAFLAEGERLNASNLAELAAIPRDALAEQSQLSRDILSWELEMERLSFADGVAALKQRIPLDPVRGAHLGFATELRWIGTYPFQTEEDYRRIMQRMEGFSRWVDDAIWRMREGLAEGVTLPRDVLPSLSAQIAPMAGNPQENGFLDAARNLPPNITGPARERLAEGYTRAVEQHVTAAFRRLQDFLGGEYRAGARSDAGLWAMPGGRALYLYEVRRQTSLGMSPEEIHALGLREVARIEAEMDALTRSLGFTGTQGEFRESLRRDPAHLFADGEAMQAEFERLHGIAMETLPRLFGDLPDMPLRFQLVEGPQLPLSAAAHYVMPSEDGTRPGTVNLNRGDASARSIYLADALALHEGLPGHHLALSRQMANAALPGFRRHADYAAFHEGWAHYAETLGADLGLYGDPYRAYGRLALAAWRASRLVVDTGIHAFGWSRADGIRYLLAHTHLGEAEAAAEVDRYIALPAQALSYKIGETVFLEWRDRAETMLGEDFDLVRFHEAALGDGAMPLPVFGEKMARWLSREAAR
jgi:uncharacterized protein (DUF885 family)